MMTVSSDTGNTEDERSKLLLIRVAFVIAIQLRVLYANGLRLYRAVLNDCLHWLPISERIKYKVNNNNVHLSCAHQRPERSHDTY